MLHILWVIIKFILILLGIVLGLVLAAVLFLLFCPVRYRICVVKKEPDWKQIQGEGKISWLFGGVSLKVKQQGGTSNLSFRLLGFPIDKFLKKRQRKKPAQADISERSSKKNAADQEAKRQKVKQPKTKKNDDISVEKKISQETNKEKRKGICTRTVQAVQGSWQKLYRIRDTWKKMRSQWNWWKGFLQHPRVKTAFGLVWKHARFLLKHLFPTKIEGIVTFSCEDPAWTGAVLAILGMTIPFHKNRIRVTPLFDGENELQGNIKMKGRAYGIVFVNAAIRIYFDKNIKYMMKCWKTRRV